MEASPYPEKVLQFGGGNFLRAFSNWMIDILNEQKQFNGSVIIVKPTPKGDYEDLRNQNGKYHIVTKGIEKDTLISEVHHITSISRVIHPYNEWEVFLDSAKVETLRYIISNTTESGIRYVEEQYQLNSCPTEYPAKITMWLHHRWQHFNGGIDKGCVILPCELIEENATNLLQYVLQHIEDWNLEDEFKEWITGSNYFCNTLVDRIVPGKPSKGSIDNSFADDQLLVMAEPYHLWAIEAPILIQDELSFKVSGLNVIYTENLSQYRTLKVRILNGAHTAMVPVGYLNEISTVREAVEDKKIGKFLNNLLYDEIKPTLDFPESIIDSYIAVTLDRFRNPFVDHQLLSISLNSISKFRFRLLPSLLEYVKKFNTPPTHITNSLAHLIKFYLGKYNGQPIPRRDDEITIQFFDDLRQKWEENQQMDYVISSILGREDFWGQDLNKIEGVAAVLIKKASDIIED